MNLILKCFIGTGDFGPKMSDQTKTIRSEVSKLNKTSSLGPNCMVNGFDTKGCFIVFPQGSTKIMNFVAKMPFLPQNKHYVHT